MRNKRKLNKEEREVLKKIKSKVPSFQFYYHRNFNSIYPDSSELYFSKDNLNFESTLIHHKEEGKVLKTLERVYEEASC